QCGCSLDPGFVDGLRTLSARPCGGTGLKTSQKCGIIDNCFHETMLVERDGLRYVAIVITRDAPFFPFKQFIKDIDAIIDGRNPCPPPAHASGWTQALTADTSVVQAQDSRLSLQEIAAGSQGNVPRDVREAILVKGESNADDLTDRVFWD